MATELLEIRWAYKGAGSTLMPGVVTARYERGAPQRLSHSGFGGAPVLARRTGLMPMLTLSVEGVSEAVAAIKGQLDAQVLVLHYLAGTGARKRTIKRMTATRCGPIVLPPREQGGQSPLTDVEFRLHAGTTSSEDHINELEVDTSDAASPPTTLPTPVVHLKSVGRGASGATLIESALSAILTPTWAAPKIGRLNENGVPVRAWGRCTRLQLRVTVEDQDEYDDILVHAPTQETLIITFAEGAADKTLTLKYGQLVDEGSLSYEAVETGSSPARNELVWEFELGTSVATIADQIVYA